MASTLYAGEIVNVTHFEKAADNTVGGPNYSYLVRVYGFYDVNNPKLLHQIEPVLCNFTLGVDHPKVQELEINTRVALPAAGIIAEPNRFIPDRRNGGETAIHRFRGLARNRIVVVNAVNTMDHTVTKTTVSKVMEKATSKGLLQALKDAARAVLTGK
jgi:hypothetical protein